MAAVDQYGVELVGVQAQSTGRLQQERLPAGRQLLGTGEYGLRVRPALPLLEGLLGRLGRRIGVPVLLQREVAQPQVETVAVAGAQRVYVFQGAAAVGALELAPDVEDDGAGVEESLMLASLPAVRGTSEPGPEEDPPRI